MEILTSLYITLVYREPNYETLVCSATKNEPDIVPTTRFQHIDLLSCT